MTRATLLQLLAHPTALTGADVHALEQLADAFPYCQTAHLLLAKAAHDQDSMLAGQRLRRAATYAANRTRLRQLIEQVPPAEAVPAIALAELAAPAEASSALGAGELPAAPTTLAAELPAAPVLAAAEPAEASEAQPLTLLEDKPDQLLGHVAAPELETATAGKEELIAEELPAQAPPIRPPAEAAVAHQEFGLAPEEPAEIMAYRLPELAEAEMAPLPAAAAPATPWLPAFSGVPDVQYAPGEGSRLGFCLMAFAPDELLPGASLPPVGEFFAPDALLLAHLAIHQPPALPKPTSLDLINSFLQRSPAPARRRTPPLPAAPEPDAQVDLSVRSTRAEADLASESLAKILARQGKTERAIAVYERLMVKQPEKMAYFAAQIESLRPSA